MHFRLDIILVEGLSKYIRSTYFPGMKMDPKYTFLNVFVGHQAPSPMLEIPLRFSLSCCLYGCTDG